MLLNARFHLEKNTIDHGASTNNYEMTISPPTSIKCSKL